MLAVRVDACWLAIVRSVLRHRQAKDNPRCIDIVAFVEDQRTRLAPNERTIDFNTRFGRAARHVTRARGVVIRLAVDCRRPRDPWNIAGENVRVRRTGCYYVRILLEIPGIAGVTRDATCFYRRVNKRRKSYQVTLKMV